jgi:multiple sugar transport system permease protein
VDAVDLAEVDQRDGEPHAQRHPARPDHEGFTSILGAPATPVGTWFFNSLIAATLHTILVLVVASLAAYALARLDFPGKKLLTALILATIFVPPISLLIPNYNIVSRWGGSTP